MNPTLRSSFPFLFANQAQRNLEPTDFKSVATDFKSWVSRFRHGGLGAVACDPFSSGTLSLSSSFALLNTHILS